MATPAGPDVPRLTGFALQEADRRLKGKEPFFPFACEVDNKGLLRLVDSLSVDPRINAPELVQALRDDLRVKAGEG